MCYYYAVIERPDGTVYEQGYDDFYGFMSLCEVLYPQYKIVDIYEGDYDLCQK